MAHFAKETGMARAKKAKSAEELSKSVNEATAAATENALRLAAEASNGPGSAEKAATIAQLARMCEEAADHMAKAQTTMFEGIEGGETAIEHLDAALQCLNKLADEGERRRATPSSAVKSA
jgi:hypothetical protein